jgi:germination protein M
MNTGLRSPRRLPGAGRPGRWLARPEIVVIVALLLIGALLRPVLALVSDPIAVAPQYARSAVTLYEVLEAPGYLVPVARRAPESEVSPEHAVVGLLAGPQAGPGLVGAFAPGAQLVDFAAGGGRARVELSAAALDGVDAAVAVDALVLTLTEFPEIASVSVAVGGQPLDADGAAVESATYLERPVLNPEAGAAEGGTEVYFAYDTEEDRYLVPVTRASEPAEREPAAAMAQFLAGPLAESDLEPVLPDDVDILGVRVEDGLAVVNFDPHLVYAYRLSKANAMFVRRAVMATLTSLPDIDAGLIEIDGSRLLLYTCVNVTQEFPQARPWAINDEYYLSTLPSPDTASP